MSDFRLRSDGLVSKAQKTMWRDHAAAKAAAAAAKPGRRPKKVFDHENPLEAALGYFDQDSESDEDEGEVVHVEVEIPEDANPGKRARSGYLK